MKHFSPKQISSILLNGNLMLLDISEDAKMLGLHSPIYPEIEGIIIGICDLCNHIYLKLQYGDLLINYRFQDFESIDFGTIKTLMMSVYTTIAEIDEIWEENDE